ncbi:MAG: class I SAM-dependent methyltransferase [Fibrobacteria bacterium]
MHPHFNIGGERFPLVEQRLELAGTRVNLAMVPYSAAELDRIAGLRGVQERTWPYWLEDWPATYVLAQVLAGDYPEGLTGSGEVLDLGCGAGVLAAFLRMRFGIEPYSCDFNIDACRLAAINVDRNGPGSSVGRVFCADFRAFPAKASFGLVLAGEMLYARVNQAPLLAFLDRHLIPGGTAYFADPGRSAAEGFLQAASASGFTVETRALPLAPLTPRAPLVEKARNIAIYKLRRMPA